MGDQESYSSSAVGDIKLIHVIGETKRMGVVKVTRKKLLLVGLCTVQYCFPITLVCKLLMQHKRNFHF